MNFKLILIGLLLVLFSTQVYADLTDGLVAYYKFDETSGTTAEDELNINDGTITGATINQTGKIGKSYLYDGTNDKVVAGTTNWSTTTGTISFWYNPVAQVADKGIFDTAPNKTSALRLYYKTDDSSQICWETGGGDSRTCTSHGMSNGTWYHIVITWNNGVPTLYINNINKGNGNNYSSSINISGGLNLGFYNSDYSNGYIDELGIWNKVLTQTEINELYNSGNGLTLCGGDTFAAVCPIVISDFDYTVNELQVDLNDTSHVDNNAVINSWEWLIDDVSVSTDQNYSFTGTEATDYNICLIVQDTVLSLEDSICQTVSIGDITPPTTTFSSSQVSGTTDQNITLTCTDNNSGCKTINYNINSLGWNLFNVTKTDTNTITTQNNTTTAVLSNTLLVNGYVADANFSFREIGTSGNAKGFVQFIYFDGTDFNTAEQTVDGTGFVLKTFTNTSPTKIVSRINTYIRSSINGQNKEGGTLTYSTTPQTNYSFLYSDAGDHNIQYFSTDNADNNETIKTSYFTTYGAGKFTFYDEDSLNLLNSINYTITPSINGVSSGTTSGNTLDLNLQGITTGTYTFTFTKPDYTTLSFTLPLTQYTGLNYNFVLINSNNSTNVNFQVFNESGAYANTKTFFAYDYSLDKYVGIQTTDTLGRLSFNLNQTKSDYNFFSTDFNFGTTVWNINKPKDALTLLDITGNWDYSITGASYSSASNIATGIQKLLLQNTVQPYTIKITDTAKNYIPTTFGLKSITSETTKTLTPYLYKRGDADLKLIKLIDFSTNQPHSNPEELKLNLYNDINGLIPIGVFVNDSTGTYNIYMDKNATYELQVLSQSYTLRPTLDIYYLYLTENINILIDNNLIVDANVPVIDSNLPIIFMQVREATFGCTMDQENCYPSMIFSLIAISLLLIVLAISGQVGAISQSVSTGILLTIFLIVGFIPLWLFGVGVVILIAWGVFGQ